MLHLYNINPSN